MENILISHIIASANMVPDFSEAISTSSFRSLEKNILSLPKVLPIHVGKCVISLDSTSPSRLADVVIMYRRMFAALYIVMEFNRLKGLGLKRGAQRRLITELMRKSTTVFMLPSNFSEMSINESIQDKVLVNSVIDTLEMYWNSLKDYLSMITTTEKIVAYPPALFKKDFYPIIANSLKEQVMFLLTHSIRCAEIAFTGCVET